MRPHAPRGRSTRRTQGGRRACCPSSSCRRRSRPPGRPRRRRPPPDPPLPAAWPRPRWPAARSPRRRPSRRACNDAFQPAQLPLAGLSDGVGVNYVSVNYGKRVRPSPCPPRAPRRNFSVKTLRAWGTDGCVGQRSDRMRAPGFSQPSGRVGAHQSRFVARELNFNVVR
eukprot:728861-Prymnesium_polylepis.2